MREFYFINESLEKKLSSQIHSAVEKVNTFSSISLFVDDISFYDSFVSIYLSTKKDSFVSVCAVNLLCSKISDIFLDYSYFVESCRFRGVDLLNGFICLVVHL